ncbi:hypothetical protein [Azospirillum sp. ST 5-10]|uniref:hypothetical protein n=1 Tax=unclassified Azospirillum TaxID=2630922 RepID=UPI003F49CB55
MTGAAPRSGRAWLARLRAALLWGALAATAGLFVLSAGKLLLGLHDNRLIGGLAAGRDLATDEPVVADVRFARAHFLMLRDRLDEAQAQVDHLDPGDRTLAAAAQYDLANARLRTAFDLLEAGRLDPAIPLVRLAKDGYRRALVLNPGFWDAKHNLDVAMRLVRDFPEIEREPEDEAQPTDKRLWTDLPGLPKGLP